ncbi:MAG: hypothetical protein M3360_02420 [Actinomycetota bacterium]|nr:hypothetical protein [Actinomycetota bacterium]
MAAVVVAIAVKPKPSPTGSFKAPAADGLQTAGAVLSIILALAAGVLAYRVIRGGRGI